jgi:hypothetical protein
MNIFRQPGNWAERKLKEIKEADGSDKPYVFETSCVNSTYELIDAMVARAESADLAEAREHCDLTAFEESLGYDEMDFPLSGDWHVDYCKSVYDGLPCYYLVHSHIEYIWVKR